MRTALTASLLSTAAVAAFSGALRASVTEHGPRTAKANVVTVTTVDYAFEAPDTIAAGRTTLRLVNKGKDFQHIWLIKLEGGHTLAKHVGKSEDFLRNRLVTGPNITGASTFYSREVAEDSLAEVLQAHDRLIRSWLAGPKRKLVIVSPVSRACGLVFLTPGADPLESSVIRVVLRRSDALGLGYRIHTAMVMP